MTFKVGDILKMEPTSRSHVKDPYYVEVVYYDDNATHGCTKMITSIPGHHKCNMIVGNNWEYHLQRMTIMGDKSIFGNLIENQRLGRFFLGDVVNVRSNLPSRKYIGTVIETEKHRYKVRLQNYNPFNVESWYSPSYLSLNIEYYRNNKIEDIIS